MKKAKLQSIEIFENQSINGSEVIAGYDGVVKTAGGTLAGLPYSEDWHNDEDGDGLLSLGETLEIVF